MSPARTTISKVIFPNTSRIPADAWFMSRKLAILLDIGVGAAQAQQAVHDLTEATLEDLMNIEITSVSKKEQKLVTAPAAVFVITQEDIRRSGLSTIPEILRMAPGLDVAQVADNQWAVSARGFNAQFSNKLLVLVDGRSVYQASTSGVYWDEQDTPVLDDIDRIEVIRGPGAALWGANAVNGVINIISKSSADTQGGLVTARTGNTDQAVDQVRYGGHLGTDATYRVYGKFSRRRDLLEDPGGVRLPGWDAAAGGFRLDWTPSSKDALTVQGDGFHQTAGVAANIPILTPPFQEQAVTISDTSGGNVLANWTHRASATSVFTVKTYFDFADRDYSLLIENRRTVDFDFQHDWTVSSRNEIVWGLGFRDNDSTFGNTPTASIQPPVFDDRVFSAFVQDEFHLVPEKLSVTVGSKFEHNDFTGFEVQPSASLMWTLSPRTAIWAAVSQAVRTPSFVDEGLDAAVSALAGPGGLPILVKVFGSPQAESETLRAYELGYRTQWSKRLSIDWTGFYNVYQHLKTTEPAQPVFVALPQPHLEVPQIYSNQMHGESLGMEIALTWEAAKGWRLSSSYSWLDLQLHLDPSSHSAADVNAEGQSPQHQIQGRSELDVTRHVQWDVSVYYVGALPAEQVPAYTRIDSRLGWRLSDRFEFSVGGQNLQGGLHVEYIQPGPFFASRIGRTFYLGAAWRF